MYAEKSDYLGTGKGYMSGKHFLESENLKEDFLEEDTIRNETQLFKLQQLKRLKQLNIPEGNDLEIVHFLVSKFKEISKNEEANPDKLTILISLEYLMHDFQVAREFHNINGVPDIIYPTLHHPWPPLQAEAAYVLASAAENCPRIRIESAETGIMWVLLRTVLLNSDPAVKVYSMFAIRCILNKYPHAQAIFINNNGLLALSEFFKRQRANYILQGEIISLLHDTLQEHNEAMKYYTRKDKITQNLYKAVGLQKAILDNGWCTMIPRALLVQEESLSPILEKKGLISAQMESPRESQQRLVEIITDTLLDLVHICHKEFSELNLKKMVLRWTDFYNNLVVGKYQEKATEASTNEGMKDNYFQTLKILQRLTRELNKFSPKDEL